MGIRAFLRRRTRRRPTRSVSAPASPTASAPTPLTAEDEIERVFKKFDSNGDGQISSSELAAMLQSLGHPAKDEEIAQMMSEADADGDGFISLEEFVELNVHAVDDEAALEDLRQAFLMIDNDGNGSISAEEIARVLRGLGEEVSLAECRRMIEAVDRDGDGLISFEEFKLMMTAGSNPLAASSKIR